jgi:hypothetical protein
VSGETLFLLLLVLACPLMMVFMMRGGHGHGGQGQSSHAGSCHGGKHGSAEDQAEIRTQTSLDELRERRDDLDARIRALEEQEGDRHGVWQ